MDAPEPVRSSLYTRSNMKTLTLVLAVLLSSLANAGTSAFVPALGGVDTVFEEVFRFYWTLAPQEAPWTTGEGVCMARYPGHNEFAGLANFTTVSKSAGGVSSYTYPELRCDDDEGGNAGTYHEWDSDNPLSTSASRHVDYIKPSGVKWVAKSMSCARIPIGVPTNLTSSEDFTFNVAQRSLTGTSIDTNTITMATDVAVNTWSTASMDFEIGTLSTQAALNVLSVIDANAAEGAISLVTVWCNVTVEVTT